MLIEIKDPNKKIENEEQIAIGIDLGTTNSLVAYSKNKKPFIIGQTESIINYPLKTVKSIKRLMGKSYNDAYIPDTFKNEIQEIEGHIKLKVDEEKYLTAVEISADILKKLKQMAEKYFKKEVSKAVITVPAYFDEIARNATKQAAKLAGLEILRLINEPTAAALAYGLDESLKDQSKLSEADNSSYYLVYDFGGGTFDVSMLKFHEGIIQVIATGGDLNLGGDDIDYAIHKACPKYSIEEARRIKEAFTENDIVDGITKEELSSIITPIVKRTIDIVKNVIKKSQSKFLASKFSGASSITSLLKGIILVGGSTRLKIVKDMLKTEFSTINIIDSLDSAINSALNPTLNPDTIVAIGAALQAESLTTKSGNLLIDVSPLSLGIEVIGGLVEKIIPKDTTVPAYSLGKFTTSVDNQTAISFHIVQGERELAKDCRSILKFELKNIPPMKAGVPEVEVTFKLDADGMLNISAVEKLSMISQEILVKPTYGLNEEEIKEMLKNAYINARKDHHIRLITESILKAEKLIEKVEKAIDEAKALNIVFDTTNIIQSIKNLKNALSSEDHEKVIESTEILEENSKEFLHYKLEYEINQVLIGTKI